MEPAGALTTLQRQITKGLGMAFGYGLNADVRDAYVFLMSRYQEGDKVFFFGFSRGAYTVRTLASLLYLFGLIRPGNESLVPYAIRMLVGMERVPTKAERDEYFHRTQHFKEMMSVPCKPTFVGVWDTVSSVGWVDNPLKLPFVTNQPDIEIGRHAIAIDERRAFFRSHLWRAPSNASQASGPRDVKQVWFPGVHSDVGGGYPEVESGLSKIALEWMLREAETAGLLTDQTRRNQVLGLAGGDYVKPDPHALAHESLRGVWHLAEYVPKKHFNWETRTEEWQMNRHRRRTIPPKSFVHVSAFERGEAYRARLPDDVIAVD